jgi:hypothetical protein
MQGNEYPELEGMTNYIGTKIVTGKPMNRLNYHFFRDWKVPDDENPLDDGYIVQYEDGYISWSPKKQFDDAYHKSGAMTFGEAVVCARLGMKVSRLGWNGSGMFAYIVPAAKYKAQTSVIMDMAFDKGMVPYREYWALFTAQKDIAVWAPSGSDSLASDWCIVD